MAISKPRNRVVLFRLTQEEYSQVRRACAEGPARSVSDFARARILGAASVDAACLARIESRLADVSRKLERLTEAFEATVSPRAEAASAAGN